MIVDADRIGGLMQNPPADDAKPLQTWLNRGGTLVYSTGGVFDQQYSKSVQEYFIILSRNAQAIKIDFQKIKEKMEDLPDTLRSDQSDGRNDRHILALALASGAEVLYTGDRALMDDFRDRAVMGGLRGRVYSGKRNKALLRRDLCEDC